MNAVLIAAVLKAIEARLVAALTAAEGALPDPLKPAVETLIGVVTSTLDAVDVAALEQETVGRLVLLVQTGKGPASSDPMDLA